MFCFGRQRGVVTFVQLGEFRFKIDCRAVLGMSTAAPASSAVPDRAASIEQAASGAMAVTLRRCGFTLHTPARSGRLDYHAASRIRHRPQQERIGKGNHWGTHAAFADTLAAVVPCATWP